MDLFVHPVLIRQWYDRHAVKPIFEAGRGARVSKYTGIK